MDPRNLEKQHEAEEPRFLNFPHLPEDAMRDGKPALNKYSSTLTAGHNFPGAQVHYAGNSRYPTARAKSTVGNALCRRRPFEGGDEDATACRYREYLVGRKPMQVSAYPTC
jgi:hypothetical protein